MGKLLFLSAMAYMAYRYITRSNRKAREIADSAGSVKILPPATQDEAPIESAVEVLPPSKSQAQISGAVETHLGTR